MKSKRKVKHKSIILSLIAFFVVISTIWASYLGAFTHVTVQEQEKGPFIFLYQESTQTSMKEVGTITSQLGKLLEKQGMIKRQPFDVYYSDGRAEIGFTVDSVSVEQLKTISLQAKLKQIPLQRFMIVEFPWRSKMSFVVGYFKVNAALKAYRQTHGYKMTEAYVLDQPNTIVYMQPIVR